MIEKDTTKADEIFTTPEHAVDQADDILVAREDLAFMLTELRGSLNVSNEFKEDTEAWEAIERLGYDTEWEADIKRIEYILETYEGRL